MSAETVARAIQCVNRPERFLGYVENLFHQQLSNATIRVRDTGIDPGIDAAAANSLAKISQYTYTLTETHHMTSSRRDAVSFFPETQTTSISTHNNNDIFIRDKSLCNELIGKLSFTEMLFFQILGRVPNAAQTAVVDACFVTLMEHGLTPSALTSRLVYSTATEAMQGAVAAGLLTVGSLFVGTMEGAAALINRLLDSDDLEAEARRIAEQHKLGREPVPGFGHHMHKPDDPRAICLLDVAETKGVAGAHVAAIKALSTAIDETYGKHITINATGATAAVLGDCGVPAEIMRGFALITRAAGLVGHIHEEQQKPAMRVIWEAADAAVPYDGDAP